MYIPQKHLDNFNQYVIPGKVTIVYGARRVGKTTLLKKYIENQNQKALFVNGDDIIVRQYLESQSIQKLKDFIGNHLLLIIDEAQYIKQIGLNLKLIVDHIPDIKVIASGSSFFDLAKDIGEPLTGRKYVLTLFPLAQLEISQIESAHETNANLEARLIYGSYPEVVLMQDNRLREEYLQDLVSSYLFKDILALEGIRHSNKLTALLQLLAFQIGKDVSINELGVQLGMSKNTAERYLNLLEQVFVIYKRFGFSRNLRKEISKSPRFYFYDNGIRNALIRNFNPLNLRNDRGALWENYIVTERLKRQIYLRQKSGSYFWRTYDKQEIDLVEERQGKLFGYEIKWKKGRIKAPAAWLSTYPEAQFDVIDNENYREFIGVSF
jgi:predicted AAA+ superfamily ATPase